VSSARCKTLLISSLVIAICLLIVACVQTVTVADPHPQISLHEPHLCKELADEEDISLSWERIRTSETKICVCGDLETGDESSYWYQIRWHQEGNEIEQAVIRYQAGAFITCLRREEGFDPGQYNVEILVGKKHLLYQEFTVITEP